MTISERKTSSVTSARSRSKIACARGSSNPSSAAASWSTAATDDPRAVPALVHFRRVPAHRSGSLGGSQPVRQVLLHDAYALEIGERIEAETSGRADGIEQAVSALPCTKQLGADSRAPAQLADPQLRWLRHAPNIQNLDETLTRGLGRWYGAALNNFLTGGEQ